MGGCGDTGAARQAEMEELRARLRAAQEDAARADAARRQSAALAEEFRRAMDAAKRGLCAQAGRARRRERAARTGERREWEARLERLVARLGGAARECSDLTGRLEEEHLLRQARASPPDPRPPFPTPSRPAFTCRRRGPLRAGDGPAGSR